ncbi:PEP-CTERM sorting domain-containing protein [Neorhodopirellula lusitana]|uniref:PEP-CTERM sorting domain-containing protein n=1 Tax=Neorhodopirellula lusitana TaxID=445327 RepID=UPI00384EBDA4
MNRVCQIFLCYLAASSGFWQHWVSPASAAVFSSFSETRHDRFLDDGSLNPNYLLDHSRITGVAVSRAVLISPQHYLTAEHTEVINPTFVAADGTRHTYLADAGSRLVLQTTLQNDFELVSGTILPAGTVRGSDLILVKLQNPISAADGITPLALLGGDYYDMLGQTMIVQGKNSQTGSDTIDYIQTIELNTGAISESLIYRWDGLAGGGSTDELRLEGGDSGEGSLVDLGSEYAFTGTNMGVATSGVSVFNFNTLVTPYLDQINAQVTADGYSITVLAVAVPEPATPLLIAALVGLGWARRRKERLQGGWS